MIGRTEEIKSLESAFTSNKPELVALLGRRRVGKTYLVRNYFGEKIDFEMVGIKDGKKEHQLRNFAYSLRDAKKSTELGAVPNDWLEAFYMLKEHLDSLQVDRKKVVFIDELPWLATAKSDFLIGFSYFWNSYASKNNILIVICGSATAWMIKKIINNKGGLHNRVTRKLLLLPFNLEETEAYFQARNISFSRYQILQLYMTMGGVPHYLDQVEGGKSAIQNIDAICFHPQGFLRTEFENLYSSLFNNPERYEAIITAISSKWVGLSRIDIIQSAKIKDGGGLSTILQELEQSGFITSYPSFNKKKKETLYRLTDNYSLFYLKFIKNLSPNEEGEWINLSQTQTWKSWSGYAFENICLQHIKKIKNNLGIASVYTQQSSFWAKAKEGQAGVQIDLLIDRQDASISLCEIKFYTDELLLNQESAAAIRRKKSIFQHISQTKKHIFIVLITTHGLIENQHSQGLIDTSLTMNALF